MKNTKAKFTNNPAKSHGPALSKFTCKELAEKKYHGVINGKLNRDLAWKHLLSFCKNPDNIDAATIKDFEAQLDTFQSALDGGADPAELGGACNSGVVFLSAISMTLAPQGVTLVR